MAVKEGSSCCCFFWETIFYALTRTWNVSAEVFCQIQDLSGVWKQPPLRTLEPNLNVSPSAENTNMKQSNSFGVLVSGVSRNTQSIRERCGDNGCVMGSRGFG